MFQFNIFFFYVFCTCFARDPPTINIPDQGTIIGKEVSRSRIQKINAYYGIPYAQPPLLNLRFAPPVTDSLPSWEDIRNATEYAPACFQTKEDYRKEDLPFLQLIANLTFPMSEDCLYLNVFVPFGGSSNSNGFATIIWFHPGNFTTGTPSIWNPHTLVYRHRVIVVTFAWRLSIMGFFTTMDGEAPGNYGLLDQQAAMMWVKRNIKLFGGNPDNICLMGYGTGGVSIGLHMINPNSQNLFNKVIIMSTNFLNPSIVKYPQEDKELLDTLAETFGCIRKPSSSLVDCLRRAQAAHLVGETANVNWRPLIDVGLSNNTQPFLTELPKITFERGNFTKVPCLTGYTNMEEVLGIPELNSDTNMTNDFLQQILMETVSSDIPFSNNSDSCVFNHEFILDSVMFFYAPSTEVKNIDELRKIISDFTTEKYFAASTFLHASYLSREQPTFVYRFDVKPITRWALENIPDWVGVPHLFDLIYVWGVPYWTDLNNNFNNWELRDKSISDIIMSFWTNFAKSSDPTESSVYPIKWDQFSVENPGILVMDGAFNMSNTNNINYKAFEFWNEYYPKVVEIGTTCCNASNTGPFAIELANNWLILINMLTTYFTIFN